MYCSYTLSIVPLIATRTRAAVTPFAAASCTHAWRNNANAASRTQPRTPRITDRGYTVTCRRLYIALRTPFRASLWTARYIRWLAGSERRCNCASHIRLRNTRSTQSRSSKRASYMRNARGHAHAVSSVVAAHACANTQYALYRAGS